MAELIISAQDIQGAIENYVSSLEVGVGAPAPAGQKLPGGHADAVVFAEPEGQKKPAAQGVGEELPAGHAEPAGHIITCVVPEGQ